MPALCPILNSTYYANNYASIFDAGRIMCIPFTSCIPLFGDTLDCIPTFPFDLPMQSDTRVCVCVCVCVCLCVCVCVCVCVCLCLCTYYLPINEHTVSRH